MRLVALISGGKDSVFNILQCIAAGHEIVAVAHVEPDKNEELDSYMYQSVGHQAVSLVAGALDLPIYRQKTKGKALCKSKTYVVTLNDEVEDLLQLLNKVKKNGNVEGVSVGAIASDYQRTRVENVCKRLNLKCFAYLWRRNQTELLQEMIDAELDAILIKVASLGLNPDIHLGMHIRDVKPHLIEINKKFGANVCGEGGEYETLTLDCPLFHRMIKITESEKLVLSNDAFAPVAYLNVTNAVLQTKIWGTDPVQSLQTRLEHIRSIVKNPYNYVQDCVDEISLNIFPQRHERSIEETLPFPFSKEELQDEIPTKFSEYWKKHSTQQPHSSHKVSFSPSTISALDVSNCDLNLSTGWCCFGNVFGKTVQDAFSYLKTHLERVKYEFQDAVFVNVFIRDMADFSNLNKTYCEYMPDVLPPARACVATHLPSEYNVLIIVIAHKLVSKSRKALNASLAFERDVMHVQSISHWAPANIGPYSQCVKIGEIYYIAGQIPLIPGTMEILNKPIFHQCKLALRHVLRIMQAMNEELGFSNILQAICYVTSEEIADDIPSLWRYITDNESGTVSVVVVSGLPKNAQTEWEVLACSFVNPQVLDTQEIMNDFTLKIKRCFFADPFTSSVVCDVSHVKKEKTERIITQQKIQGILKRCVQFLRKDIKINGTPLCMLKVFYKFSEPGIKISLENITPSTLDSKVVATSIPVLACKSPDIFLTITGVCH